LNFLSGRETDFLGCGVFFMEFLVKKNLRIAATEEIFKRKPDKWDEYSHSLRNKHHKTVVMGSLVK